MLKLYIKKLKGETNKVEIQTEIEGTEYFIKIIIKDTNVCCENSFFLPYFLVDGFVELIYYSKTRIGSRLLWGN